jgi:hypothetical protein
MKMNEAGKLTKERKIGAHDKGIGSSRGFLQEVTSNARWEWGVRGECSRQG